MASDLIGRGIDGPCLTRRPSLQVVVEALNAPTAAVQDVGVEHGRFDVLMPEEFLDRSNSVAPFQQMCRKGMESRNETHR